MPIPDIDDNLGDFADLVSLELFAALTDNMNSMIDAVAAGEIATILMIPGVTPALDPTIWQECNGAVITEPLSPLRGKNTPDMRDRYLQGATTLAEVGLTAGSNHQVFAHNHDSQTDQFQATQITVDASSGYWEASEVHSHSISTDLNGFINMEPVHFTIKHFYKIR